MRTVRVALAVAALWAAGLVVAALTLPAYTGSSSSTDADGVVQTTSTTATLVEANGSWGLAVACVPLAACLGVGALLLGPGGRATQWVAVVLVALLGGVTVLSLLSIGVFVAPVVAALLVAVVASLGTPRRQAPA